jgi:hypothetical protein
LRPPVEAHRCRSFVSTWKANGKQLERLALTTLYPRPDPRGFTVGFGKSTPEIMLFTDKSVTMSHDQSSGAVVCRAYPGHLSQGSRRCYSSWWLGAPALHTENGDKEKT